MARTGFLRVEMSGFPRMLEIAAFLRAFQMPPFSVLLVPESGLSKTNNAKRGTMRSELVYSAGIQISNRFLLSTVAMNAVRKLHINSTRVEDTTNRVFSELANGSYLQVRLPEVKPAPEIDPLLLPVAV